MYPPFVRGERFRYPPFVRGSVLVSPLRKGGAFWYPPFVRGERFGISPS